MLTKDLLIYLLIILVKGMCLLQVFCIIVGNFRVLKVFKVTNFHSRVFRVHNTLSYYKTLNGWFKLLTDFRCIGKYFNKPHSPIEVNYATGLRDMMKRFWRSGLLWNGNKDTYCTNNKSFFWKCHCINLQKVIKK